MQETCVPATAVLRSILADELGMQLAAPLVANSENIQELCLSCGYESAAVSCQASLQAFH